MTWKKSWTLFLKIKIEHISVWCKRGPGPRDLRLRDSGTRDQGPPSKFKSGTSGPPSKFNEFIFFQNISSLFYLFIFVSFLNKIQKNVNCE